MGFSKFMASPAGRVLRMVAGIALIIWGIASASSTLTVVLIVVGLVPLLAGLFDWCVFAPLFGAPIQGKKIRES